MSYINKALCIGRVEGRPKKIGSESLIVDGCAFVYPRVDRDSMAAQSAIDTLCAVSFV